MMRRRDIVLINLNEMEHDADNIADAIGGRKPAVALLRAMAAYLDPEPPPTLWDGADDATI